MNRTSLHKILRLIIVVLLASISYQGMAQVSQYRSNFSLGVGGGLNFNTVAFSPSIKQGTHQGINAGIAARYICEKYFAMICGVQVEVNLSQRGWKEKIEDGTGNTYQRTLNYVEIPFLAHLAFGPERGVRFFINAGPQIGLYLSDKEEMGGDPWNPSYRPGGVTHQYGKAPDNSFDYGIAGGLGLEVRTGAGNFLAEGRYYYGLSDIYGNSKRDYFSRSGNSTIGARITYFFDITK